MRGRRFGERGILVECDGPGQVAATYRLLRARAEELGAVEVVPAARTVLLDGVPDVDRVLGVLGEVEVLPESVVAAPGPVVEVPTRYDGEDLDEVARQWDRTTAEVVRIHQGTTFEVLFCGFAPGFAYCAGLPPELSVRRRADPRPRVPAGAVALAGEFTSVYPGTSPGGWQLIGSTALAVWRPGAAEPALLVPGARVRFVDA